VKRSGKRENTGEKQAYSEQEKTEVHYAISVSLLLKGHMSRKILAE
jgi:hypothetical protein